jgi:hypothetical protein
VNSLSLVRYRGTDYSVPTAYGHREVLIRGYVDEVVISCGADIIARHARSYEREDFVFEPLHYLALLEQKTGALDQAAPLVGWELPEEFATFRRLLEARMGKRGKREFVQILRLLETFHRDDVVAGIKEAMARGAIGFDAVKHLVLRRIERRPPRLDLTIYPYLPRATVATTSARTYLDGFSPLVAASPEHAEFLRWLCSAEMRSRLTGGMLLTTALFCQTDPVAPRHAGKYIRWL